MPHQPRLEDLFLTRRQLLSQMGNGFAALSLTGLMASEGLLARPADASELLNPLAPKKPHFPAKAKRVIFLFMNGGPSHVDTFDPKPALTTFAGTRPPAANLSTERKTFALMPSPFKFRKYGESGLEVSDLFPRLAQHADDLCVIRSMHTDIPNHEPGLLMMCCGSNLPIRPSFGTLAPSGQGLC